MTVRALVSFTGIVSMAKGREYEIEDKDLVKELLKAGYVEEVEKKKSPKKGR